MKQDIKSRQSSGKTRFGSQKAGIWKQNEILGRLLKLPGSCSQSRKKKSFQQDCALQWQGWKTQQKNNRKGQPLQKKRKMLAILWKTIRLLLLKMRLFRQKNLCRWNYLMTVCFPKSPVFVIGLSGSFSIPTGWWNLTINFISLISMQPMKRCCTSVL